MPQGGAEAGGSSSGPADAAAGEAARKRARTGGVDGDAGSGGGSGPFAKILRACKPQENKPLIFEVQLHDGSTTLMPSVRLRRECPLLLVDFYESRMAFPA